MSDANPDISPADKGKKWSAPTIVKYFGAFLVGSIITPFVTKYTEKFAEGIFEKKTIRIEGCAPLKDARLLIRKPTDKGEELIADQKIEHINETSVFVQNLTDKPIKNATLTVYPLSQSSAEPEIWYSRMYASSIKGASAYKVGKSKSAYQINIPILNTDEFILIETKFGEPIGYVVELFSEDMSKKVGIEPGCADGSYIKSSPPTVFYSHYGNKCQKPEKARGAVRCNNTIETPLQITEDMGGKYISVETKVTY
ncbi:MAG: hypothetical protein MIN69_12160 [Methylorubrum extorquens]|jgi:hypothetical protein|uniref:hypothetical protein n=1 Tax=Methylorubrum extorquens TaxID=408 RepID=UPI002FEE625B